MRNDKKRVVITGMGIVSCFGDDVDTYYNKLLAGESGVTNIDRFPCEEFSTKIAAEVQNFDASKYIDKKQLRRLDDYIIYITAAAKNAFDDGKFSDANLDKTRCGVIIGSGMGGMKSFEKGVETVVNKGCRRLSPFFVPHIITNMGGAFVAMETGFKGPNYSISTACATANYCITSAANHIRHGDADVMLCGGGEAVITPMGIAGFMACKALSQRNDAPTKASRPWDKGRDGFVAGEGAGVLVLENLEHAQQRGATIYAEYLGGSFSCDAYHMTSPCPDGSGAKLCMKKTLEDAGIAAEDVNYINTHGTSTQAGDMAEIKAMQDVFGARKSLTINSTKSMIGHGLAAAGGFEAIATIKAITTGNIHPTINIEDPEPEIADFNAPQKAEQHDITAAMSNSFGFGGHNSAIILAPYNP
ncbi:MAG: beta-ketoacyl-ACP synthase II [Waddliaceae bacterium]|nr:beta-ketoacyl-ACP synthase II [Waddliaceae bacterium]MBT3579085.1 beta-ketoacyl-ACP synthase II [Waddliaceae bacterium]MBT4444796.1 beta-ketoacyl-ACP synthase II [Waddliaceae bacterium]MBT6928065.1 beta-ketoacyl-ACP synthase II [Waddliaceae bacterium]MBT7264449.1 beta-ketoacyl-ACP synthase II [Waddliaceae bacterium]